MGEMESVGVSVSFGKYENDGGLCWEKWSTFSPKKYLEEVGKCSTPGSVAQKKAFFEAHYKKIAALKAQAEEEDHSTAADDEEQQKNVIDGSDMDKPVTVQDNSPSSITTLNSTNSIEEVPDVEPVVVTVEDNSPSTSLITTLNSTNPIEEVPNVEPIVVTVEDNSPSPSPFTTLNNCKPLEAPDVEIMKQKQKQHLHVTPPNKIIPNKVEKSSIGMKKKTPNSTPPKSKPTSAAPKPSSFNKASSSSSLYKSRTPSSSLNKTNTPSSSLNKASSSLNKSRTPSLSSSLKKTSMPSSSSLSSSKNKNYSASESRRATSMSLHLSMSMNSVISDTASSVTSSRRCSLFMEQMGDKDIVKRAFKTFQNRFNQLPSSDTGPKQLPTKRSQQKTWTTMVYQKENERSRKAAEEKINPARGQTWKPAEKKISPARGQTGSLKGVGVDERTSVALKSDEKRKEFFRKLEEKSNARKAEASQLSLKSKEVKDAEMKRVRQSAKAQGVLKST